MAQNSVDTGRMAQAVNAFENTVAALQGQMRTADGTIAGLQASWQSDEAAPRFHSAMGEWKANGDQIVSELNQMSELLKQTHLGYSSTIDTTNNIAGNVHPTSLPGLPL
jgi:WXG100 family type VII secretion target